MDTIRKQLVDDKRAQDIFARVRSRLSQERVKTNEKYLELIIEEINSYFIDLSTSTINSSDLPNDRSGPSVEKHNKLLVNIANDIDKTHKKRIEVQDLITKAVNYLSTERVSLNNAVSKAHSRIINQKLRSAMNDRRVTVFTEYFTDDTFVDKTLSKNIAIKPSLSALTLSTVTENTDNSSMIDPSEIYMEVKLSNSVQNKADAIYPIAAGKANGTHLYAGFGRTLSYEGPNSELANLHSAGFDDDGEYINIQKQCLIFGTADPESESTFGEFELIFNDFSSGKMDPTIIAAIKKSPLNLTQQDVDENHVIIEKVAGKSFNGARLSANLATDPTNLKGLLESMGLRFKLKQGDLRGLVSFIDIMFHPAANSLLIPKINYASSYIKDTNGKEWHPFTELSMNVEENKVTVHRGLMMNTLVPSPSEIYIDFDLSNMKPELINSYLGTCWKVRLHGSDVKSVISYGDSGTPIPLHETSTNKFIYVYHDVRRTQSAFKVNDWNLPVLNDIISIYKTANMLPLNMG